MLFQRDESARDTAAFVEFGYLRDMRARLLFENKKKAVTGLLGALGSFRALRFGTFQGPLYADFSASNLALSLDALSSQKARSSGGNAFQACETSLATDVDFF